jgi:hypothetical protein
MTLHHNAEIIRDNEPKRTLILDEFLIYFALSISFHMCILSKDT